MNPPGELYQCSLLLLRLRFLLRLDTKLSILTLGIETGLSEQYRPRSDDAECCIWSGYTLFATHVAEFKMNQHVVKWPCSHLSASRQVVLVSQCLGKI